MYTISGSGTSAGGLPTIKNPPGGTRKPPTRQEEDMGHKGGPEDEYGKERSMDEEN